MTHKQLVLGGASSIMRIALAKNTPLLYEVLFVPLP